MTDKFVLTLGTKNALRSERRALIERGNVMPDAKEKREARKEVEFRRKKTHIINCLYTLSDRGVTEATARQIAEVSDYRYSGDFSNFLNLLADEGYLRMEVYSWRGGSCSHKFTYRLPEKKKAVRR
jgi:hypothetical protein